MYMLYIKSRFCVAVKLWCRHKQLTTNQNSDKYHSTNKTVGIIDRPIRMLIGHGIILVTAQHISAVHFHSHTKSGLDIY
jgi:hypothetical protein